MIITHLGRGDTAMFTKDLTRAYNALAAKCTGHTANPAMTTDKTAAMCAAYNMFKTKIALDSHLAAILQSPITGGLLPITGDLLTPLAQALKKCASAYDAFHNKMCNTYTNNENNWKKDCLTNMCAFAFTEYNPHANDAQERLSNGQELTPQQYRATAVFNALNNATENTSLVGYTEVQTKKFDTKYGEGTPVPQDFNPFYNKLTLVQKSTPETCPQAAMDLLFE